MMKKVKLVDYTDSLAQGIKEMWDNSIEGWNGEKFKSTEQTIKNEENNSSHLQLKLAQIESIIAGYCKLSIDHQDTGALYIDLLSVRDGFQGKKIGKRLVKDAVEKTIELGWPRLDLHTWDGNIKAVPLYKKCGFFWEKRDDETHLINLIPTVLQTELFSEFFKKADWYKDSVREIKIEPDINIQNKFNIWTYRWENGGDFLEIDFTRRGRGITRIENSDYLIRTTVENLNLVFGQNYKIKYEFINKSGKPLNVEIKGKDNKNIIYKLEKLIDVKDQVFFHGEFCVGPILNKQVEWKTHPSVISEMKINGKSITFKTGVVPEYPLTIDMVNPDHPSKRCFANVQNELYLNLENHYNKKTSYRIKLPDCSAIDISPKTIDVILKANEKKSVPLKYIANCSHFYSKDIDIEAVVEDREPFVFRLEISEVFRTGYGHYFGESREGIEAGIGNYYLWFSKEYNNTLFFGDSTKEGSSIQIFPFKLGLPYSNEFEHKSFDKYEISDGNGWILLKMYYTSSSFKGVNLKRYLKLYQNGVMERWIEIVNNSEYETDSLNVSDSIKFEPCPLLFSYNDKFISLRSDNSYYLDQWDTDKFTENWLMAESYRSKTGFKWSKNYELKIVDDEPTLITSIGKIEPGKKVITDVITTTCNTFRDWHTFREFVLGKKLDREVLTPGLEYIFNDGNPFVKGELSTKVVSHSMYKESGDITLSLCNGNQVKGRLDDDYSKFLNSEISNGVNRANLKLAKSKLLSEESRILFNIDNKQVKITEQEGVLKVDNGIIAFESSRSFGPSIHSLKYNGTEWLDSNYPEITNKSWWNPWLGGLAVVPDGFSLKYLLDEKTITEFVEKIDIKGNRWTGLSISINVQKNENKKGFSYSQYYLTLPGVPVLLSFCEFTQKGEYTENISFIYNNFFKGEGKLNENYFKYINNSGLEMQFNSGVEGLEGETRKSLGLYNKNRNEHITLFCNDNDSKGYYMNQELIMIWFAHSAKAKDGEIGRTRPNYIIFSKEDLDNENLRDLNNVKFV